MRQCQCQGVGHCCLGPKQTPVSPPAHEETGMEHSGDMGWMEGNGKRKERKRREGEREREKKGD